MKAFLCELILSCLVAVPAAKGVDELTYGTVLYAYYQGDDSQALLETLVAERQGRLGDDPVRFELAKGSFAFRSGLYQLAARTFDGVAAGELSELDRARLAFHQARERYRRQDWPGLERALAEIQAHGQGLAPVRHHPEVAFMMAEAALARGDLDASRDALAGLETTSPHLAYGLFNLGVAARAANDAPAARQAFSRLAELSAPDPETRELVQRGRLALAVLDRETGQEVDEAVVVARLPGAGRYRDQALATYAGHAMETGDYELSARIWLALQKEPRWNVSTAAALLGYPMSLEHLEAPRQALHAYQTAERAFQGRLGALRDVARSAGDPLWVRRLLEQLTGPAGASGTTPAAPPGWSAALGAEDWLEWLAGEEVHGLLTEWREMTEMLRWLDALPQQLVALDEVAAERRRRLAAARALADQQGLRIRREQISAQIEDLGARLAAVADHPATFSNDWMMALASPEERRRLAELDAMDTVLEHVPAAERETWSRRVRRLRGSVFWQIADSRSSRIRVLEKALHENRGLLAQVDDRLGRLAGAEERFAVGVQADFSRFESRAGGLRDRVASARSVREAQLAAALARGLEREASALEQYLLTARIAIARATDQLASRDGTSAAGGGS